MENSWKMEEFTAQEIHEKQEARKIVVPKYQRGIVWRDSQKKELIDSIKKGIPFGSILLYLDENANNYRLIDGLQRCTTIYEFISNPANFYDEDDIDDNAINELIELIGVVSDKEKIRAKIIEIILQWIKLEHKTMQDVVGMQFYNCALELSRYFPTLTGKEQQIVDLIKPMFKRYIQMCDKMSKAKIPAIVITGSDEVLPIVFERINSKGSHLTKWQIYAATWSENKIRINKELNKIIDYNKERYEEMTIDDDINLQDFDPIELERKSELNTFELIFGFGKMISEMFPQLFSNSKKATDVNSIGFNLVNACLVFKNNEIKNLNKNLSEIVGNSDDINRFLLEIIECIKIVDKAIAITTKFKSNVREDTTPLHTEMQICSMIASVFINKHVNFEIDEKDVVTDRKIDLDGVNENWKSYKETFINNALKVYLLDILQINWRGSGDKKLNYIIINPAYYTRNITKEEFESALNLWYESIKNERNEYKKIMNPKEADKVLLNIIYSNQFKAIDQIDDSKYDIEHIATKGMMKKQLERFDGKRRLPISSIGNICLLPEEYNRGKGERTIYQYNDDNLSIAEIEEKYSFTERKDLEWIEDNNLTYDELRNAYIKYIDTRFEKIKEKLFDIIYK